MKPKLKRTGTKRLKLKCDILLSTSAFKFNLRRYTQGGKLRVIRATFTHSEEDTPAVVVEQVLQNPQAVGCQVAPGRAAQSFPFLLNLNSVQG
jgi:hypothetical protein